MIVWDEAKRKTNLEKHGLDFADAYLVFDNPNKITFQSSRKGEARKQDIAMVEIRGRCTDTHLRRARSRSTGNLVPGRFKGGERGI